MVLSGSLGWARISCGAGREALTDIFVKAFEEASTVHAGVVSAGRNAAENGHPQLCIRERRIFSSESPAGANGIIGAWCEFGLGSGF